MTNRNKPTSSADEKHRSFDRHFPPIVENHLLPVNPRLRKGPCGFYRRERERKKLPKHGDVATLLSDARSVGGPFCILATRHSFRLLGQNSYQLSKKLSLAPLLRGDQFLYAHRLKKKNTLNITKTIFACG